jgi:polar amino acid transport system substrate-binding protein
MRKYFIIIIYFFLIFCGISAANSQYLRWAADAEGNAPFIFQDPRIPSNLIGFEVDIVEELANEMGLEPVFVQNQWDGLIAGLSRDDYDIAINGLEITEDRKQQVNFSIPYYITFEQLVVKKGTKGINSLIDLVGKRAGALKNSLAERILNSQQDVIVKTYEGEVNAFSDMLNGRLDAVLVDSPIALYYASWNEDYELVGEPIGDVLYGIVCRKQDSTLINDINNALNNMIESGKLREILEQWNLWNEKMADYTNDNEPTNIMPDKFNEFIESQGKTADFDTLFNRYVGYLPLIGKAALTTLWLSIVAMIVAIIAGLIIALVRVYAPFPFAQLAVLYIEIIRGTPLLIQLFFIFYALPSIGITLSPELAAILGLGFNYAAYEAENFRAGLFSVPRGQMEAAISLGMNRRQSLRFVVLPQAIRLVIPPLTNDYISLLKDSSLVAIITMVELTKVYTQISQAHYDYFIPGIIVAGIYLLLGLPFVRLSRYFENRFSLDKQVKRMYR